MQTTCAPRTGADREAGVVAYLREHLPPSEERVETPMAAGCEVSIVVPVYGERDYIIRALASLARQVDVDPAQYEVLVVVNNPPDEPRRGRMEAASYYARRLDHYRAAVSENVNVLQIVAELNGRGRAALDDHERALVEAIASSGIRVHAIDKASPGRTLPEAHANVGGARNRGLAEAVARFHEHAGVNGIVAHTDADCRFDRRYVAALIEAFRRRPGLVGLTGTVKAESDYSDPITQRVYSYQVLEYHYRFLARAAAGADEAREEPDGNAPGLTFSGPNMASRAYEAALAGGVPKVVDGEDGEFGRRLAAIGEVDRVPDVIALAADRMSVRTSFEAGWQTKHAIAEACRRKRPVLVGTPEAIVVRDRFVRELAELVVRAAPEGRLREVFSFDGQPLLEDGDIAALVQKARTCRDVAQLREDSEARLIGTRAVARLTTLLPRMPIEQAVGSVLDALAADPERRRKYEAARRRLIEQENQVIERRRRRFDRLLDLAFSGGPAKLDAGGVWRLVSSHSEELGVSADVVEDVRGDLLYLRFLAGVVSSSKTKAAALQRFETTLEDAFVPVERNPVRLRLMEARAMREAVSRQEGVRS